NRTTNVGIAHRAKAGGGPFSSPTSSSTWNTAGPPLDATRDGPRAALPRTGRCYDRPGGPSRGLRTSPGSSGDGSSGDTMPNYEKLSMVSPELRKIKYGVPELRVAVEGLIPALKTI